MKRKGILISLTILLLLAFCSFANAEEEKTVKVTGEGVIFNKDKALAKEKAIDQALRMAVEQVVGTYIESHTLVENYVTVEDKILSQSTGFVKSWKELSSREDSGVIVVEIEATVASGKVKNSLDKIKAMLSKREYPRVMFLIPEQNIGQTGFSTWLGSTSSFVSMNSVENVLAEKLGDMGFVIVDPQVLAGKYKADGAFKITSAGVPDNVAREIADLTDAQVLIVGTAIAVNLGQVMEGVKSQAANSKISIRAINTDNGEILMTANVKGYGRDLDATMAGSQALVDGGEKLAKEIAEKLAKKWLMSASMVTVELNGLSSYQQLDAFKRALREQVGGVKAVMERKMKKDKAQLDLKYSGKTSVLARELTAKTFEGFKVSIDEVTPNKLVLTLSK